MSRAEGKPRKEAVCVDCGAPIGPHGRFDSECRIKTCTCCLCSACLREHRILACHRPGDPCDVFDDCDLSDPREAREVLDEARASLRRIGKLGELSGDRLVVSNVLEAFGERVLANITKGAKK